MRLDSVRELKVTLLERVAAEGRTDRWRSGGVPPIQRSIALGVTRTGLRYLLAVRVQRRALMTGPLLEEIVRRARGEVDVRFLGATGKRGAPWYQCRVRPLLMGTSACHFKASAGSIGCFCTRDGDPFMLSNNHVLANEDFGKRGDEIVQPSVSRGGRAGTDCVARLGPWVKFVRRGSNLMDAALGRLDPAVAYDSQRLRAVVNGKDRNLVGPEPEIVDIGEVVYKVGQSTGATKGRVSAFELDNVVVNYTLQKLQFDAQIEIDSAGRYPFSEAGDSGALVVNGRMRAVGLLFASSGTDNPDSSSVTLANPIGVVLEALKATLLC